MAVVVTAEHASRAVPRALRRRLRLSRALLASHGGFDRGARALARALAAELGAPLVLGGVTRLVVDLNRSPRNPAVFSRATRGLPSGERRALLTTLHAPYWEAVDALVGAAIERRGAVVHLAAHSFTPVLGGARRDFDVGLLFDPARAHEVAFVRSWLAALSVEAPWLRVRMNAPYRGTSDGLTTALRRRHRAGRYAGIEVEVNQAIVRKPATWRRVRRVLAGTAGTALATYAARRRADVARASPTSL